MTNYHRLGAEAERAIKKWAVANGFPLADRTIRTGAGKNYEHRADQGDLWLAPGLIVQSKRLSPVNRMERAIPTWMAEAEAQRVAAGADIALLIVRREGTADVGEWWAWLPLWALVPLSTDAAYAAPARVLHHDTPVRLTVADVSRILRAAGYGEPLVGVAA